MIPDEISRVLSGFVDKELDAEQRQAVIRLARRSRRVRALLLDMHLDSRALRSLAAERPVRDFSEPVLRQIAEKKVRLEQRSLRSTFRSVPSWVPWATAATVVVALGAGIYGYRFARHGNEPQASHPRLPKIAQAQPEQHTGLADVLPAPETTNRDTHPRAEPPPKAAQARSPAPLKADSAMAKSDSRPGTSKSPAPPLVSPVSPRPTVAIAKVSAPLIVSMRELKQDKRKTEILDELNKADGRMEFSCLHPGAGVVRLRRAFETRGVVFLIDKDALARIEVPFMNSSYAMYLENLKGDDILAVLRQLAIETEQMNKDQRRDVEFDSVELRSATEQDRAGFSAFLGGDVSGVDLQTADERARYRAGEGGVPADAHSRPNKSSARTAVIVTAHEGARPVTVPALSPEIQQFFAKHRTRRPGSVHMLIYVSGK